jgi:hypothetical protein
LGADFKLQLWLIRWAPEIIQMQNIFARDDNQTHSSGRVWVLHPIDVSVKPFFLFHGSKDGNQTHKFWLGLGFAPDENGCKAIFSPVSLAKSDPVIFDWFLKTRRAFKTRCKTNFSPTYFAVSWVFYPFHPLPSLTKGTYTS